MDDSDIGYYQILDNYTIWRLETITNASQVRQRPLRVLSFPSHEVQHPISHQISHLVKEVPVHKKRNLARNLRVMIEDLQIKVERIEAEVNDNDIVTNIITTRSKPPIEERIILESDVDKTRCDEVEHECQHFNELSMVKQQLEMLSGEKSLLEEQIVRMRLDKSSDQGTDSEKRLSKLETENKLLKEQLKLSFEKICQLNKEKCQEISKKIGKSSYISEIGSGTKWREIQGKLKKYQNNAIDLKEDLKSLKQSIYVFFNWGFHQMQQGDALLKEFKNRTNLIPQHHRLPLTNGFREKSSTEIKIQQQISPSRRPPIRSSSTTTNGELRNYAMNISGGESISNSNEDNMTVNKIVDANFLDNRISPALHGSGVLYRLRPILEKGQKTSINLANNGTIQVQHRNRVKTVQCERIIHPSPSQDQLFEFLKPITQSYLNGTNGCIFLYGERGAGKTYTAEGCHEHEGVLALFVGNILNEINGRNESFNLSCNVAELRNEVFRDVLNKASYLETKQNTSGGITLSNWTQIPLTCRNDYNQILERCRAIQKVHSFHMSHLIHAFNLSSCQNDQSSVVRFCIVDLADSERNDKPSLDSIRIKEAQIVSKSLNYLGDVLHAINSKKCHVPYRTTKLTHFLQDYLQNNCRSELVVHLKMNDSNSSETISSLLFGQRTIGGDVGQPCVKTPTKSSSRSESHNSTPRPRRPSTGFINLTPASDNNASVRRSSASSERSYKKMSITPRSEGKY